MDYYEELDLRPTATDEEIRAAYRVLVRLLHPDGHQNEQARALAACQMRRLNQIVETLTNAERRAAYDRRLHRRSCRRKVSRPVHTAHRSKAAAVWAWAVAIALLGLLFYFRDGGG